MTIPRGFKYQWKGLYPGMKRPKTIRCRFCKKKVRASKRGRVNLYCSASCRQNHYQARKWAQLGPVAALNRDIWSMEFRTAVRKELWLVLREVGLVGDPTPPPVPRTPRRGPALRVVEREQKPEEG